MQLRKTIFPLCFLILLIVVGCECAEEIAYKLWARQTHAVVFCDVSSSMDSLTYQNMSRRAMEVMRWLFESKAKGEFYFINRVTAAGNNFIFDVNFVCKRSRDFANAERKLSAAFDHARKDTLARQFQNRSCIIDAIDRASRALSEANTSRLELIFISDMLEDCNNSLLSYPFYFHGRDSLICADSLLQHIPDAISGYDLSNVKVTVVLTSIGNRNPVCLEKFWKKLFKACGVSVEDKNFFHFSPDVPPRMRKR